MTRTPYLTPEQMNPEQRRIYDDIVASRGTWLNGPYAPMLHQPRLAEPAQKLGEFLRYHTSLKAQLSELAILVVARHWDCDFEWYQHAAIALRSGVSPEIVEAIREGKQPGVLSEDESAVYEFTRSLLKQHRVPSEIYDRAKRLFGVVGVVELTGLIGYYTLIAFTLNAHEVPLPAGVTAPLSPREALMASGGDR
jgi:4-carboxymuconolactone decarboxylase